MTKLGLKSSTTTVNWAVKSWSNCIDQLDEQFDIVFFGDSITYEGDWKEAFNTHRVINFGYPGDTLQGMTDLVMCQHGHAAHRCYNGPLVKTTLEEIIVNTFDKVQ